MLGEVPIGVGVRGGAGYGGADEGLIAAEVLVGERGAVGVAGARVGGGSGTGVDALVKEELPTPPAPSKWTYSTVKSSYVGAEPSSTALSHAHPRLSSNTTSRAVRTRCLRVEDAVGLRALRVADEHSQSAPVVELADVAKLLGEREAAEDPQMGDRRLAPMPSLVRHPAIERLGR